MVAASEQTQSYTPKVYTPSHRLRKQHPSNDLLPGFRCCCIRGFLLITQLLLRIQVARLGGRAQEEPFIPAPPRLPPDSDARVGAGFPGRLITVRRLRDDW